MVSVVRFTVNYFTEPFLAGFYLQGVQHRSSRGGKVAYFRKAGGQSWIMLQMFTSSNFSRPLAISLVLWAEFIPTLYAHMEPRLIISVNQAVNS